MPELTEIILSSAELQAVEDFTGVPGTQDPRRWWMALEMTGRDPLLSPPDDHPARILKLFDMKMSGDAAVWADDTPEVAKIVQSSSGTVDDVKSLKQMFLNRFKKTPPKSNDLNRDLEDLRQGHLETLEDYHTRARRILLQMCEDSSVNGVARTMSKAESQWVMTVVSRFTRGLQEKWVEFQVSEAEPTSLEKAFLLAKEQTRKFQRYIQKNAEWHREGYDLTVYGNPFGGPILGQAQGFERDYRSDPQGSRPSVGGMPKPAGRGPGGIKVTQPRHRLHSSRPIDLLHPLSGPSQPQSSLYQSLPLLRNRPGIPLEGGRTIIGHLTPTSMVPPRINPILATPCA